MTRNFKMNFLANGPESVAFRAGISRLYRSGSAFVLFGSLIVATAVFGQPLVPVEGQPIVPPPPAAELKSLPDNDNAKQRASTKAAGNSQPAEAIRAQMPALPP